MRKRSKQKTSFFVHFPWTALLLSLCAAPAHAKKESWYRDQWCAAHHGKAEVPLPDRSRADCITDSHAVEIEFASKWKNSIGQSLNYAMQTNKKAGVVLVLNSVITEFNLPIKTWLMK